MTDTAKKVAPKAAKADPKDDNTTVTGFLAIYDRLAKKFKTAKRWCSIEYAYSCTGESDGVTDGYRRYRIPSPGMRQHMESPVPAKYLNEAGQAWRAEQDSARLAEMRKGARQAILYGLEHANITQAQAEEAAAELGLPKPVKATGYQTGISLGYSRHVRSAKSLTAAQRIALRDAIASALTAAVEGQGLKFGADPVPEIAGSYRQEGWTMDETEAAPATAEGGSGDAA